jgi:hypothetical protein
MTGARLDEVLTTKLSVDPQLAMTGWEQPYRHWLPPQCI